ncbi:MAG: N-acetylmuramoyl-L-alanine amidase [Pyrinomonadaceae bacterium]|nr:N-acetylmuramoyl-L-alanine amidase [Phycisphaerales bacterium]
MRRLIGTLRAAQSASIPTTRCSKPRRVVAPNLIYYVSILVFLPLGCSSNRIDVGQPLARSGDEIVVCGQYFHTGAPVVLWTDPGGYDAYRVEKRFVSWDKAAWTPDSAAPSSTPNRYGIRFAEKGRGPGGAGNALDPEVFERVRGGGWDLASLRQVVDQFVIHYDVCGTSRQCFRVLHDVRGLSVHFMLDVDGTIYQTLDLKERAWHATTSNDRSIGIEIAHIGAYPLDVTSAASGNLPATLKAWYAVDNFAPPGQRVRMTLPPSMGDGGIRTPNFIARPARDEPTFGVIQGQMLAQYDLTPQQYDSLIKLTASLCTVLPNIRCDYPRDQQGQLITDKLPDAQLAEYHGLLGHYHIQDNKADPGPAFDFGHVVAEARRLMKR